MPKLSAGRVQSVATRILVERERARMAFRSAGYWDIDGVFSRRRPTTSHPAAGARWSRSDGARVATGRDFDSTGELDHRRASVQLDEAGARALAERLAGRPLRGHRVEERPYRRSPYAPFMTSTLQQEAGRKLRFSSAADDADRAAAVRERLHHLHAYRLDRAVGDGGRGGAHAGRASSTARSTCRRSRAATPARSRTRRRPTRRSARPATRSAPRARSRGSAQRRRVPALRADLAAHGGQPDGRRHRHQRDGPARRRASAPVPSGQRRRLQAPAARSSRSPASCGPTSRAATTPTPSSRTASGACRRCARATGSTSRELDPARPHHLAAGPLHRGQPGQDAGGARHRPARAPTPASSPRSRTAATRGRRAAPWCPTWLAFAVVKLLEDHFGRLVDYRFTSSVEDDLDEIAGGSREPRPTG